MGPQYGIYFYSIDYDSINSRMVIGGFCANSDLVGQGTLNNRPCAVSYDSTTTSLLWAKGYIVSGAVFYVSSVKYESVSKNQLVFLF
jgi:hypothetical protein